MSKKLEARLRAKKEELSKKGGNGSFFFFKEGTSRMRLVPVGAEKEFAIEATYFYLGGEIKGVVSPMTFNEPCGIMEAYQKLKNSKNEDDREMAKKVSPKKRYFILAYKYKDEKAKELDTESGVRLAGLTNQQYQDLIDLYLDDEAGDMTDPKTGYDVKFKRTGSGQFDTEYSILRCNSTPIHKSFKGKTYDPETELKKCMPSYEETVEMASKVLGTSKSSKSSKSDDFKDKVKSKKKKKITK